MQNSANNDNSLNVNTDVLLELCAKWKSTISGTGLSSMNVSSTFSSFIECGIGTNFFSSLDTAIKKVDNIAYNLANSIDVAINDQILADTQNALNASENFYGADFSEGTFISNDDENSSYDVDNTNKDLNINSSVSNISFELDETQKELSVLLKSMDPDTLTEIKNLDDIDEIKNKLLSSPNISADLIEQILLMPEDELKARLASLLSPEGTISDFSLELFSDFDSNLKDINKGYDFNDSINKVSNAYGEILNKDNTVEAIKKIYLSEDTDEVTIFTKGFVDKMANEQNITPDELFNDSKYESYIDNKLNEVNNSFSLLTSNDNGDEQNE